MMKTRKFKRIIGAVTAAVMSISAMSIVPEMFDLDSWLDLSVMAKIPNENASVIYNDNGEKKTLKISNNGKDVVLNKDDLTSYKNTEEIIFEVSDGHKLYFPEDSSKLFNLFTDLESIDGLDKVDTSNVTNMSNMFYGCNAITTLDLRNFDTSSVTDMSYMFANCFAITDLTLSSFNTSSVTNMRGMFWNCKALSTLTFGDNINTAGVTNMSNMFTNCYAITALDLSKFNTSSVTNMGYMFANCYAITTLDLSKFNTSSVTDMSSMFWKCKAITTLDLINFDTSAVTNMGSMFEDMTSLEELKLGSSFEVKTDLTLSEPAKSGYTFEKWKSDDVNKPINKDNNNNYKILQGTTGLVTYTAEWKQNSSGHSPAYSPI